MQIEVNDKFKNRIPPLSDSEYRQLEQNIIENGCRDPLVLWEDVLLDGHNRHRICTEHGISFETVSMEFADEDVALDWMDKNQIGRRNLSRDSFNLILGRIYNRTKKAATGRADRDFGEEEIATRKEKTSEKLAEHHGVSERTVRNAGKAAATVDNSPLAGDVMSGKAKLNEAADMATEMRRMEPENKTYTLEEAKAKIKAEKESERECKKLSEKLQFKHSGRL